MSIDDKVDFLYSTIQCDSTSPRWGDRCILPHGHGGDHESTQGTWTFGSTVSKDEQVSERENRI